MNIPIAKGTFWHLILLSRTRLISHSMTLFFIGVIGVKTMKKYGIILDFKDKMITVDEVKLPM